MDIQDIYKKYKKEHRKEKPLALLFAMQEIELRIKNADVDAGFMREYKFYKGLFSFFNIVMPGMAFGIATGVICSVVDSFVAKIKDIYLLTFSNLLFVSVGVFGFIFIYLISCRHTLMFILLPYAINLMEEKIKEYNNAHFEQHTKSAQKVAVKMKRKQKQCKPKRN